MNNKFLELAEQAGYQEGFRFALEDFDLEKFAELIVKECASICDRLEDEYLKESGCQFKDDDNHLMGMGAGICCNEILDHFGVEE